MQKITIKSCIDRALELGVPIYGDTSKRGKCNAEDAELASFHQWVVFNYPEFAPMCFHVPNEWQAVTSGGGKFAHAAKMKNMGVISGLADWICLGANGRPSFLCEMKKEHISESLNNTKRKQHFIKQCELLHRQKNLGAVVCVALGFESAKAAFIEYLEE